MGGVAMPGPSGVEGVGEVVENDARLQAEQVALAVEQGPLDGVAVLPKGVGGDIQGVGGEIGGLEAEQFAERGVLAQPAQGLALAARMQGAGQDLGEAQADVAGAQAALEEALAQAELAGQQVEQAGGTGLARVGVAQGGGQQGERGFGRRLGRSVVGDAEAEVVTGVAEAAAHEGGDDGGLGGDALGESEGFRVGCGRGWQAGLSGERVLDGGGELLPVAWGDALLEAAAEMGEDQLADLGALALGVDQAVSDTAGGAFGASFDAPDEHSPMISHARQSVNTSGQHVVSTFRAGLEIRPNKNIKRLHGVVIGIVLDTIADSGG